MDWNVYFDARPAPSRQCAWALHWQKWQERGHDQHSLVADPLFVAPRQNDFRLSANSPALKLGFRRFDLSGAVPLAMPLVNWHD